MTRKVLHIVSGIPPDSSGTGRLLAHLINSKPDSDEWDIRFYYPFRPFGNRRRMLQQRQYFALARDVARVAVSWLLLRVRLRLLKPSHNDAVLVFHPQTLGFDRTLRVLHRWRGRAFLFGLDNSFFCVRSYNYIPGEASPCLRCLGGRFEAAAEMGCQPFPVVDSAAHRFVRDLFDLLRNGDVCILAQNRRNAELYRRHAGDKARVQVVGLWTADWTSLFQEAAGPAGDDGYDIVFHGHFVPAKGADWMLEVARHLPEARFLFPTPLPTRVKSAPENVTSSRMTWETGLDAETARARIVCVPSLWSATIEGALIKSIMFGRAAARINITSAYGDELPEGLILDLDPDPVKAAAQLGSALENNWMPDRELRESWLNQFKQENFDLLGKLLRTVKRSLTTDSPKGSPVPMPEPVGDSTLVLETLGTPYGGWSVPVEHIDENWICYCVGAGEDVSFDCALIERFNCDVFVLDPTPRAIAHVADLKEKTGKGEPMPVNNNPEVLYSLPAEKLGKLHFYPYGVWSENVRQKFYTPKNKEHVSHSILNLQQTEDYFEAECRTLASLMDELGHDRIDLLKLDVEGAEYEILNSMLDDGIRPRVLCIEFDEGNLPLDSGAPGRIAKMIHSLQDAGFVFVRKDKWNTIFVHKDKFPHI